MRADIFIAELQKCAALLIKHEHVLGVRGNAIWKQKSFLEQRQAVLPFDFAENWNINLPKRVQDYCFHKKQQSIFSCVATTPLTTKMFAVISDDLCHDSSHTLLLALKTIAIVLEDTLLLFCNITYISDGAPAHFKNRFQLWGMIRNTLLPKWLFTASVHGKNNRDAMGGSLKYVACLHNFRSEPASCIKSAGTFVSCMSKRSHATQLLHLP